MLLYLQGYRYDFEQHRIEQTGALMLTTVPARATIVLNGQSSKEQTPVTIQSLEPAQYDITITAPGYQSWHKLLSVRAAEVTFSGSIRLFPPPHEGVHLTGTTFTTAALAPNRANLLYFLSQGLSTGLWLLNLTSGQTALITRPSGSIITSVEWAPSSREFLVAARTGDKISYRTYNVTEAEWDEIALPGSVSPQAVHWGEDEDYLYIATDNEIYQYTRSSHNLKLLWRERITDFRIHDGIIYGLTEGASGTVAVRAISRSNLEPVAFDLGTALSTNLSFLEPREGWLPLYDNDRHTLFLLHSPLSETNYVRRLPEVTEIDWSPDGNELLLTNNIEVWNYNVSTDKLTLIRRISTGFSQARRLPTDPYLTYATGNEVWTLEFDTRAEQQSWLIGKFPAEVIDLFIDPRGATLYAKTVAGLYQLTLVSERELDEQPGGSPVKAIQKYLRRSTLP